MLFVVGTIPQGISNCYKQKCLKGVDLEVHRLCGAAICARMWTNMCMDGSAGMHADMCAVQVMYATLWPT